MSSNRANPAFLIVEGLPQVVSASYSAASERVVVNVEGRGGLHVLMLAGTVEHLGALVAALADAVDTAAGAPGEEVVIRKDLDWPVPTGEEPMP